MKLKVVFFNTFISSKDILPALDAKLGIVVSSTKCVLGFQTRSL